MQLQQAALWGGLQYVAVLLLGVAVFGLLRRRGRDLPSAMHTWLALAAVASIMFALCGLRAVHFSSQSLVAELEGRDLSLVGVVAAMPQRNDTGLRFRLEVESATLDGQAVRLPPLVQLGWYGGPMQDARGVVDLQRQPPELRAGERWRMTVRLKQPHGHRNPHGFDYELWLWEQGVQATGYVRAGRRDAPASRIGDSWRHPVERARQTVRDAILREVPDRQAAGVLAALVVGDQHAIERADWDIFRATGVAHLMSISGMHVTMFAWAAVWLVGGLWRRSTRLCLAWPAQHAALVGGVLLATGYALFSGWGVPAQRTVWMLAVVALLRLSGRRWPWPQVWLLVCAVVVSLDPWALMQPGFWLSFVAVGVLFATDMGACADQREGRVAKAASRLLAAAREQWAITLALTPLTLLLFGQVSLVGVLANAVAIAWVTLLVTPLALAGIIVTPLWQLAAWALEPLTMYLGWLASLPFASVSAPAPPLWTGGAGLLGGLLLAMRLPWRMRSLGLPLLLPVLLWQTVRPALGQFELLAADVGQGNAVIVRTARHTLVYDAGPRYGPESDAGHRVLVPLLRARDDKVGMVMLSHRDADHTGGASAVLAMHPHASLLSSLEDGHELQSVRPSTRCAAGQRWEWDGVEFAVLAPAAPDYRLARKSNAMSCVLRISNGSRTALLAGDIERTQEGELVAQAQRLASEGLDRPRLLRADLLLVPHHGSKTSSSEAFIAAVRPSWAIVQAGYRNRFGHPAEPVLARYRDFGVRVVDSPRCGAARWESARPDAMDCERDRARRYWHHPPF